MFKVCDIAKTKNEEIARFIGGKIDIATELAANKGYLDTILKKCSYSIFDIELHSSTIDSGLNKGLKANKTLFFS